MKLLYILRVVFVSLEALLILIGFLVWTRYRSELQTLAVSLQFSEDLIKYLMLLPTSLGLWIVKECRLLLQEDKETIRLLTLWEDYWALKVHVWVSIFYVVIFGLVSIIPWTLKSTITTSIGILIFLVSLLGQCLLAITIFNARILMNEKLIHVKSN